MEQLAFETPKESRNRNYHEEDRSTMRGKVLLTIERLGPITNREIAKILNVEICSVTGRNKELRDAGRIKQAGQKICSVTRKRVTAWTVA